MYKVLLADDEAWVVESLKTIIDWEALGYKIIGQAGNGIEAFNMILEYAPHIVITDIRMPDMNGLELIKKASDLGLDVLFIIASGYAEFAYAQKAMNYGAIGYCLKPFDEMEIKNCLDKAGIILKNKIENRETDIIELIEGADIGENDILIKLLKEHGLDTGKDKLSVLASIGKGQIRLWEDASYLTLRIGALKKVYIVRNDDVDIRDYLKNQLSEDLISIGIGDYIYDISSAKNAISDAICCSYNYFVTGRPGLYEAKEFDYTAINDFLRQLKAAVANKDITLTGELLKSLKALFREKTYNIKAAYHVYIMAVSFVFEYLTIGNEAYIEHYELLTNAFENISEMFDYLEHLILDSIGVKPSMFSGDIKNETIKELIGYVNSSFNKEISVQSLSNKYFINPNYISRVFKKEVGQNFIEYLTRLRVEYASRLLKETKMPVQQVSEKTGYNDYFYFTRIFKKATGKTPSQYRSE